MFERNRVDRLNEPERSTSNVEVTLDDGEIIRGRMHFPPTRSLGDELNNASGFVDLEVQDGERLFLAKGSIQSVKPQQIPRVDQLNRTQAKSEQFNPWTVLGVAETAGKDEIREAYHRLVKQYHPDRFANTELPREVKEYLNAMSRRVNSAYSSLAGGIKRDPVPART